MALVQASFRYDPAMPLPEPPATAKLTPAEAQALAEYDDWRWHVEGHFPKDQPPEQGYVHIGVFVTWLLDFGFVDPDWVARAGAEQAVTAVAERRGTPGTLRDVTEGRLVSDMLTPEGRAFTGAYYAPEYGYARDWRGVFGRRADRYDVPDAWETYDRIAPLLDRRHEAWVAAGKPELMPLPGLPGVLLRLFRPKGR
jgi:hypothetical protein